MRWILIDSFSLLCGVAGWFYVFYSKAAAALGQIESPARNALRVNLRRLCGGAMVLLGIAFFAGSHSVDDRQTPGAFLAIWLSVILLLAFIILLAAIDIRLTSKLRQKIRPRSDDRP
jgi:cytochrome bd-type quinol oxidase subunit 2